MKTDDNVYVGQIMEAIRQISVYLRSASPYDFARNKMLQDAMLHQLAIADQASRDLSLYLGEKHQGISRGQLLEAKDGVAANIDITDEEKAIDPPKSLTHIEREHIKRILNYTRGNRTKASQLLGISRITLLSKIHKYNLE